MATRVGFCPLPRTPRAPRTPRPPRTLFIAAHPSSPAIGDTGGAVNVSGVWVVRVGFACVGPRVLHTLVSSAR